jgi:hypothetical protein
VPVVDSVAFQADQADVAASDFPDPNANVLSHQVQATLMCWTGGGLGILIV